MRIGATVLLLAVAGTGFAQAPAKKFAAFDVASVKENKGSDPSTDMNFPLGPGDVYMPSGGYFKTRNLPLTVYIMFAYKLSGSQMNAFSGQFPDWAKTSKYDIEARVDGDPNKDEMRAMMQALLSERFGLKMHTEMRETSVLDLVVAKPGRLGPRLREHPVDDKGCPQGLVGGETLDGYPNICGGITGMDESKVGQIKLGARNISMAQFAGAIPGPGHLGKLVVDKTGLTGKYDFTLEFAPEAGTIQLASGQTFAPDESASSFLNALTEQMGLKLTSDKTQAETLVLDHIDHLAEN